MTSELLDAIDAPKRKRRRRRKHQDPSTEFYCSFGRHRTYRQRDLKEQYDYATICMTCQVKVMENLEKSVFMPELSEAMRVKARKLWEEKRSQTVAELPMRRVTPDMEGMVYYLRINGQVKIGYTKDLKKRSRAYPPGSLLLAVEPGNPDLERSRHKQFFRDLAKGREWFYESDALVAHVAALVAEFGRPEALMHKYTAHEGARKVQANG